MVQVLKGNVQLTINEDKLEEFLKLGYSQIDEKGEIVKAGYATTLKEIKEENNTLKAELAKYQDAKESLDEVANLKADNEALGIENTTLKEGLNTLNSKYENLEKENEDLKAQLEAANKKTK